MLGSSMCHCHAGLSLLGYEGLKAIDPAYALPVHVVDKLFQTQE